MIRITRLTDYGIVLMTYFAREPGRPTLSARGLAAGTQLPLPTVGKILKTLVRDGFVVSQRGVKGGYSLAREPEAISVGEVIAALEGPVSVTDCGVHSTGACEHEPRCPVRSNWQRINRVIRQALENLTIAELARPLPQPLWPIRPRGEATQFLA